MTVDRRLRGPALVLGFADYAAPAQRLADRLRVPCAQVTVHRFPDGESRVTVPVPLPARVALCRSLDRPNDKLVETILAAAAARKHGAHAVTLVAPYLPYMRQDAEFTPGDAVSQRIVGALLAERFDAVARGRPRFLAWYRVYAHAIRAVAPDPAEIAELPTVLVVEPAAVLQLVDRRHWRGHWHDAAAEARVWTDRIDALLQRCTPALPATTLGL